MEKLKDYTRNACVALGVLGLLVAVSQLVATSASLKVFIVGLVMMVPSYICGKVIPEKISNGNRAGWCSRWPQGR